MSHVTLPLPSLDSIRWREAISRSDLHLLRAARQQLETHLRESPEQYAPLDAAAQVLAALGEGDLARRLLDAYLAYAPDCTPASARLAWLLAEQQQHEEALAEINSALARDPHCVEALRIRSAIHLAKDRLPEALADARAAFDRDPDDRESRLALMRVHLAERRLDDARVIAGDLLTSDPYAAMDFARGLCDSRQSRVALALLQPFATREDALPETWPLAARAALETGLAPQGFWFLRRMLTTEPPENDQPRVGRNIQLVFNLLGAREAEAFLGDLLREGALADGYGVEMLEQVATQGNRPRLDELFRIAGANPLRYPRTVVRYLTTHSEQAAPPDLIPSWIAASAGAIATNTHLWAGVGTWFHQNKRYREAADHLVQWPYRQDVRPWMLFVLGKALEELDSVLEANAQYRAALAMEPDHSTAAIRTRLAFNLAVEGSAAQGVLVARDLLDSPQPPPQARAVLALFKASQATLSDETIAILNEGRAALEGIPLPAIQRLRVQRAYQDAAENIMLLRESETEDPKESTP
jgi:tetratricopeptide (TPR) repeat protein